MTVHELYERMPYTELQQWLNYFERRPVGWRDDDRMFKLIKTSWGFKGKATDLFPNLAQVYASRKSLPEGQIDVDNLKRSFLFNSIISAEGGDKLEFN